MPTPHRPDSSASHSSPYSTSAPKPIDPKKQATPTATATSASTSAASPSSGGANDAYPGHAGASRPRHRASLSDGATGAGGAGAGTGGGGGGGSSKVGGTSDRRHKGGLHTPSSSRRGRRVSGLHSSGGNGTPLAPIGSGRARSTDGSRSVGGEPRKALSPAEWMRSTSPASQGSGSQHAAVPLTASPALFGTPVSQQMGFSPSVRVTVVDAETREDTSGRYTAFRIAVHNGMRQWSVARRYSEFRTLHVSLSAEFPNTRLPKIPPKKFIGVLDPRFVAERRDALMK